MTIPLSPSARKVQDALTGLGFDYQVVELPQSTRTALEAAQAVGCQVEQIVKSLVFKGGDSQRPVLVVASGPNRVNEEKIEGYLGEPLKRAGADFVRQHTGFVIGGVPPLAHPAPIITYIDTDLLQYDWLWAAAGTPHAVFRLTPVALLQITAGKLVEVK